MNHTICNQVRFEIDEKDLTAALFEPVDGF